MGEPVRVLFVCVGNCVRSQMAEAIARHACGDIIAAESAGVSPLGFIDKTAKMVLHQKGISVHGQYSKGLQCEDLKTPQVIINMSGIPGNSLFAGKKFEDWEVEDPFGEDIEVHRRICDSIEARVTLLAAQLRTAVRDTRTEPGRGSQR
jgi:arsenate reductase (thioredoxin)